MSATQTAATTITPIHFNDHEFYFLLSQFAPVAAVGWENPYTGWLAEEIEAVQTEAFESLIGRDIVRMVAENEIAIEESIVELFSACAQPDYSLLVSAAQTGGQPLQFLAHAKEGRFVRHYIEEGIHSLLILGQADLLAQHLLAFLYVENKPAKKPAGPFQLSEDTFLSSEELTREGQAAEAEKKLKSELKGSGQKAIITALTNPLYRSAVILISEAAAEDAKAGVAVYQSQAQTWLLRPFERGGKKFIDFVPANAASIAGELSKLLLLAAA